MPHAAHAAFTATHAALTATHAAHAAFTATHAAGSIGRVCSSGGVRIRPVAADAGLRRAASLAVAHAALGPHSTHPAAFAAVAGMPGVT
jgi:hypothetical protein